jgi:hypothetical protein
LVSLALVLATYSSSAASSSGLANSWLAFLSFFFFFLFFLFFLPFFVPFESYRAAPAVSQPVRIVKQKEGQRLGGKSRTARVPRSSSNICHVCVIPDDRIVMAQRRRVETN